jgi:hypothetical protein
LENNLIRTEWLPELTVTTYGHRIVGFRGVFSTHDNQVGVGQAAAHLADHRQVRLPGQVNVAHDEFDGAGPEPVPGFGYAGHILDGMPDPL